jgi:hypothetical protein
VVAGKRRGKRTSNGRGPLRVDQRIDLSTAKVRFRSALNEVGYARRRADQDESEAGKGGG